jgi:hypothetical protein
MHQEENANYSIRLFVILCVLFLGSPSNLSAQYTIYGIATKNNLQKHGKVLTYEPMKVVVMECFGDTLSFDLNEYNFRFTTKKPPKPYFFPDGVVYHRIALGALPGKPGEGGYVNYTFHYQKNRLLGYGGGLSFENYGETDGYDFLVPNVVMYSYLSKKNMSPFVRLTAGYGFAIKNISKSQVTARGGLNAGAALGLRLSTNRIMIDFALGAKFQKGYYEFEFADFSKVTDAKFKRIDFSIGFMW